MTRLRFQEPTTETNDARLVIGTVDLPGICGERLAHVSGLSLEGDGALEAER